VDTTDAAVVTHADYSVDAAEVYAGPARSTGEIAAARVLHTREYDAQGAIDRRGEEAYDDGWMDRREWLVVADGRKVLGTASLIVPTDTLPTLAAFGIDPLHDPRIGHAWRERRVVEVSALARDRRVASGPLVGALIYRALWMSRARRQDHDVWLMSMSLDRLRRLAGLFPVPFELLTGVQDHYRHASVACALDLRLARAAMELRSRPFLHWLDGCSDDFELVPARRPGSCDPRPR